MVIARRALACLARPAGKGKHPTTLNKTGHSHFRVTDKKPTHSGRNRSVRMPTKCFITSTQTEKELRKVLHDDLARAIALECRHDSLALEALSR